VHPVAVVLSILLHVSAYIGHLQVLRIQNDIIHVSAYIGRLQVLRMENDILYTQYLKMVYVGQNMK
jgi:hypothetical protein